MRSKLKIGQEEYIGLDDDSGIEIYAGRSSKDDYYIKGIKGRKVRKVKFTEKQVIELSEFGIDILNRALIVLIGELNIKGDEKNI